MTKDWEPQVQPYCVQWLALRLVNGHGKADSDRELSVDECERVPRWSDNARDDVQLPIMVVTYVLIRVQIIRNLLFSSLEKSMFRSNITGTPDFKLNCGDDDPGNSSCCRFSLDVS